MRQFIETGPVAQGEMRSGIGIDFIKEGCYIATQAPEPVVVGCASITAEGRQGVRHA
jgi:hypothetical protein